MKQINTHAFLSLGFAAILGMLVILTITGLTVIRATGQRLEQVVLDGNFKTKLVMEIRTAARERTVSLQKMLLIEDPFERDSEWMRFNTHGTNVIVALQALEAVKLNQKENAQLREQVRIMSEIGPLQSQIAELILDGKVPQAQLLLTESALPLQDAAFGHMSKLLKLQEQAASDSVTQARQEYRRAVTTMLVMALGLVVLGTLVARSTIRRSSEYQRGLQREKHLAQVTLHSIGDGVISTDSKGHIVQMNDKAETLTGSSIDEAYARPLHKIFQLTKGDFPDSLAGPIAVVLNKGKVLSSGDDAGLLSRDGERVALEYTAAPIRDNDRVTGAVLVFRDVSVVREMSRRLAFQASHDELTGLFNRRELLVRLNTELTEIRRYKDQGYWLCFIDLDQFKVVNDTCGHMAGDELLKQVSQTLLQEVRESDLVVRLGGDEFAILIKRCEEHTVVSVVERIRRRLQDQRFSWSGQSFATHASIGVAPISPDCGTVHDLLRAADTACYIAKDNGRNRIHIYKQGDNDTERREGEMQWVSGITKALAENRFVLYYQPIIPICDNSDEVHCEVLVRMLDETGSIVPPLAFIPAAERYNLMTGIDRWVVRNALTAFAKILGQRLSIKYSFSINISAQSLCDDDFLLYVMQQLDQSGIDPHQVCFEITETSAISNLSRAMEFINTLRKRGCRFSLDDFGSGLSSFGYLKDLPVDHVKIDGSFVRGLSEDAMARAMVEAIDHVAKTMGIKTIAEYVDSPETAACLKEIGIDFGQGYGLGKPLPLDELIQQCSTKTA